MKKILPQFKDDTDKIIVVATVIGSIFFVFFPALIAILFGKNYISESSYQIVKSILNFELFLFLVSLIFMIPIIGWLLAIILAPLMVVINTIIMILDLCAIAKNTEVKIPVWYEFI